MTSTEQTFWRRCSNCKKEIPFGSKYSLCSVASCTKVRAPTQFCSPDCWAVHNEIENHKDAWAVEQVAPSRAEAAAPRPSSPPRPSPSSSSAPRPASSAPAPSSAPSSVPASAPSSAPSSSPASTSGDGEVLVVVSRLKDFIKSASNGMSTSDQVLQPFSVHVRRLADAAIEEARRNSRKTLLGRDVPRPGPQGTGDVLVVVSRLKEYVRARSDMRTSDEVPAVISNELRRIAHFAIETARKDGRKTVMGRDVPS